MSFKAVLCDMDGTLIVSEHYWIEAERRLFKTFNLTWTKKDGEKLRGCGMSYTTSLFRKLGVKLSDSQMIEFLNKTMVELVLEKLIIADGALKLLDDLIKNGIKCALVTSSHREYVNAVLKQFPDNLFDAIVTADTIKNDKPHPEPYLTAAKKLNCNIKDCIGLEDSYNGAKSVIASGAKLVAYSPEDVGVNEFATVELNDNILVIKDWNSLNYTKLCDFYNN
jgi:HAD superfamily hydrolase (TIGR01509 family)